MESARALNSPNALRRWLLAGVGMLCVALAAAGAILPGLPTTIFLLAASWCFVRSCPWLEQKLLRNRLFAPYMRIVDGRAAMPLRTRIAAIVLMWVFVVVSMALLHLRGGAVWVVVLPGAAAVIGTVVIARFRRCPVQAADSRDAGERACCSASRRTPN